MTSYWFATRPKTVEHRHPFLVFDIHDRLHLPLTVFAREASVRLSPKTAQTYLYALTPFFTYLDTDVWLVRAGTTWAAPPQQVRYAVEDYLVYKLQCQVHPHHQGWKYVALTTGTRSTLRVFLAALKMFYLVMRERETYGYANPMVDQMNLTIAAIQDHFDREEKEQTPPPMPMQSGVEKPRKKPAHRLTDSYYKLEHEDWTPVIIDDPKLPADILEGGKKLPLKYTRLRDEVVTWLLFETGARISEVTGLMLGDWAILGTRNKVKAFNKGSYGRRTKTLSFADDTVILLKRYFDNERVRFDAKSYALEDYLLLAKRKQIDLGTIPLFLTVQGTQLTPKEYREHYWNPACAAADPPIEADVHQARHWHVTREVRDIYETAKNEVEVMQRLSDLVQYMNWRSEETLAVYNQYFDQQRNDDRRTNLQKHMHEDVRQRLQERQSGKQKKPVPSKRKERGENASLQTTLQLDDELDLAFLYSLGREV